MSVLVIGRTGQMAVEAGRLPDVELAGREAADLSHPDACGAFVQERLARGGVEAVVNAAAWTAVDAAEAREAEARVVNADAPGAMARACAAAGVPFVHVSTDYVFGGSVGGGGEAPRSPGDPVSPVGAYGRTKLAGEEAARAAGGVHAILRTSWVFGARGSNFAKTMLRLGAERDALRVVDDQVGGPTPARDLAAAAVHVGHALARDAALSGTYHFAGVPDVSWAGFARAIFAEAGIECAVEGIASSDYPTPAARPLNSRLDCSATEAAFGLPRPDWRAGLRFVLAELGPA